MELKAGDWADAGIRLSNAAGEEVSVGVSAQPLELFVDRRKSRRTPFHAAYAGRHAGPIAWRDDRITLRVLFDRSVIEVFANDGETVISERVYPTEPFDRLHVRPTGAGTPRVRLWEHQVHSDRTLRETKGAQRSAAPSTTRHSSLVTGH